MLLYGDFNFSHTWYESIDIRGEVVTVGHVRDDRPGDLRFQACLEESHLAQLVTFLTYRNSRNEAPSSTLDLLITDDPDRLIEITETDSLGYTPMGQAHCMLSCTIAVTRTSDSPTTLGPRFIWSRANYEAIISVFASCDWLRLFNDRPVNECYNLLFDKYNDAVMKFIPTTTAPFKPKEELRVTQEVLEAVELKRELLGKDIFLPSSPKMPKCSTTNSLI
jgi:hypothetical protein